MRTLSSMTASRGLLAAVLGVTVGMVTAGCADDATSRNPTPPEAPASSTRSTSPSPGPSAAVTKENRMRIRITIGEQCFGATLSDSAAGRDLPAQLPVSIEMVDHGQVEKTGPLPSPLSLKGQPEGADPDVGDLGYHAPGNDLVLYYGDQSYFPGIVILGRLDGDAAQRISELHGPVAVRVEVQDD